MIPIEAEADNISIELEIEEYIGSTGGGEYETYEGEYEVVPKANEQHLETKNKSMKNDVVIKAIPVHEVSNKCGNTLIIGGIV